MKKFFITVAALFCGAYIFAQNSIMSFLLAKNNQSDTPLVLSHFESNDFSHFEHFSHASHASHASHYSMTTQTKPAPPRLSDYVLSRKLKNSINDAQIVQLKECLDNHFNAQTKKIGGVAVGTSVYYNFSVVKVININKKTLNKPIDCYKIECYITYSKVENNMYSQNCHNFFYYIPIKKNGTVYIIEEYDYSSYLNVKEEPEQGMFQSLRKILESK